MNFERKNSALGTMDVGMRHLADPVYEFWMYGLITYPGNQIRPAHQLNIKDSSYIIKILEALRDNKGIEAINKIGTQYMRDFCAEPNCDIKKRQRKEGDFRIFNPSVVKETKEENEYRGSWTILHFKDKYLKFKEEFYLMPSNINDYVKINTNTKWFDI